MNTSVRLRRDQIEALEEISDRRVVGRNLLMERAVDLLIEGDRTVPHLLGLPDGPRPPGAAT